MSNVKWREPKPGETCFGGGSGILIPFVPSSSEDSEKKESSDPQRRIEKALRLARAAGELKLGTVEKSLDEQIEKGLLPASRRDTAGKSGE